MTDDTTTMRRRIKSKKLSYNNTSNSKVTIENHVFALFLLFLLEHRHVLSTIFIGLFPAELYWNANCKRTKNAIKPQI